MVAPILAIESVQKLVPDVLGLSELTSGGQKAVYRGSHQDYGELVIKVVTEEDSMERVQREVLLGKTSKIPHTPKLYYSEEKQLDGKSVLLIYEEFLAGTTLRHELNSKHHLPIETVCSLVDTLLEAVVVMEEMRVVHRDIKPENIMCCNHETFKLLDFGIARHLTMSSITSSNCDMGPHTRGYASLEQLNNQKQLIDSRADLFSIGVVAYEAICGEHPYCIESRSIIGDGSLAYGDIRPLDLRECPDNDVRDFVLTLASKYLSRRPGTASQAKEIFDSIKKNIIQN